MRLGCLTHSRHSGKRIERVAEQPGMVPNLGFHLMAAPVPSHQGRSRPIGAREIFSRKWRETVDTGSRLRDNGLPVYDQTERRASS